MEIVDNAYERGKLKDGYKTGVWEYYDEPGKLALKLNYTSSLLLFQKPDTSEYVVKVNNEWTKLQLHATPRYIGSMHDFIKIQEVVEYPIKARSNETCGKFYIFFEVDTLGQAGNYEVFNDIGDGCAQAVVKALQMLPNYWLIAQKDGKKLISKFVLPVVFTMFVDGKPVPPKSRKQTITEFPLATPIAEMRITSIAVTHTRTITH